MLWLLCALALNSTRYAVSTHSKEVRLVAVCEMERLVSLPGVVIWGSPRWRCSLRKNKPPALRSGHMWSPFGMVYITIQHHVIALSRYAKTHHPFFTRRNSECITSRAECLQSSEQLSLLIELSSQYAEIWRYIDGCSEVGVQSWSGFRCYERNDRQYF